MPTGCTAPRPNPTPIPPLFIRCSGNVRPRTPTTDRSTRKDRKFLAELEAIQTGFIARLRENLVTASWVEPGVLQPRVRLLQILDGLSLALCSPHIPPASGRLKDLVRMLSTCSKFLSKAGRTG